MGLLTGDDLKAFNSFEKTHKGVAANSGQSSRSREDERSLRCGATVRGH